MSDDAGAERWLTVHDELLRGIAHALSNRIAAINAASYMFEHGDVPVEHVMDTLRVESERMEKLLQQLRLLPAREGTAAEPCTANDACAAAVGLHSHHAELGDYPCAVTVNADVYPILVEPQSFNHALVMAIHAAKRNAGPGGRALLSVTGDVRVVVFRAEGIPVVNATLDESRSDLNQRDASAAGWLLLRSKGSARSLDRGSELEVPTLLAARRAQKGL